MRRFRPGYNQTLTLTAQTTNLKVNILLDPFINCFINFFSSTIPYLINVKLQDNGSISSVFLRPGSFVVSLFNWCIMFLSLVTLVSQRDSPPFTRSDVCFLTRKHACSESSCEVVVVGGMLNVFWYFFVLYLAETLR